MAKLTNIGAVVEKWMPVYERAIDDYEKEHPDWRLEVLVSLIQWGLRSLRHYIENPSVRRISWDDPFVALHYEVDWNWKRGATGDITLGGHTFGTLTRQNTSTKEQAVKTLGRIMTRQFTVMALADLTNGAWYEKRGRKCTPVLPVEISVALNSIKNPRAKRAAFDSLVRPFSIGGAYVDYGSMEMRNGEPVSKEVASQLAEMGKIPRLDFSVDVEGRKFEMSLVFVVDPLIADYGRRKAYHKITVGLAIHPGAEGAGDCAINPAGWSPADQQAFWEGLLAKIGGIAADLAPGSDTEESVILSVNSQLKVPASWWKPENRSATIKRIADFHSGAGALESLSVQAARSGLAELGPAICQVCGWLHDAAFTQIKVGERETISLSGLLPDIVRLVHGAHEKGFNGLSTKDEVLLRSCGGYRNPCKAFGDLNQRSAYQQLFDTRRRGFISLRGAVGTNRNKSESSPE